MPNEGRRLVMQSAAFDRGEMIEKLKLEIAMVERGGYNPSVHNPRSEPRIFRDSITCLNVGLDQKKEPCSQCFLIQFVPKEYWDKEEPCHYIPLNSRGDTVASLQNDPDRLQVALLGWLYTTLARLQTEVVQERQQG
jgi:hypothetical protein